MNKQKLIHPTKDRSVRFSRRRIKELSFKQTYDDLINEITSNTEIITIRPKQVNLELIPDVRERLRIEINRLKSLITTMPNENLFLEYANAVNTFVRNQEIRFKVYANLLSSYPHSASAHLHIGQIFSEEELYKQAYLLFDKGLRLGPLHGEFHFELWSLAESIARLDQFGDEGNDEGILGEDIGFPDLHFRFSREKGFYLEDFDFNVSPEDSSIPVGRAYYRTIAGIHYKLGEDVNKGGISHESENCPYLNYLSKITG